MKNDGKVVTKEQLMKGNWTPIPNEVLESNILSDGAVRCYGAIASHVRKGCDKIAWPGQKRLARMINASVRSVQRYVQELRKVGVIRVEQTGLTQTNRYYLCEIDAKRLGALSVAIKSKEVKSDATPVSLPDTTLVSSKEEEDINDDAEFCKQNSLSSKKNTTGVSIKADDLSIGFSPVSGILDKYIKSKEDGEINE